MPNEPTPERLEQQRRAALKHGLYGEFAKTSDTSLLDEPQRARWLEIREQLATPEGRIEALSDATGSIKLIIEMGEAWLREEVERVGLAKAFTSPMLARHNTFHNTLRLNIVSLHQMAGKGDTPDASALIEQFRDKDNAKQKPQDH